MVEQPSNSELYRLISRVEAKMDSLANDVDSKYISREVLDARFALLSKDIDTRDARVLDDINDVKTALETMRNWQQWMVRLVVGTIATVILTFVLTTALK